MSEEAKKQPWEQQADEPPLWFDRFWKYCQLGSKRTLQAVIRAEARTHKVRKGAKRRVPSGTPGAWQEASTQWHWHDRASAWDADQREKMLAEYERRKAEILSTGFALNFERIEKLDRLAELLWKELNTKTKRWLPDVKQVGSGDFAERVDIVRFNSAIIEQFRDTLDDIAREMGERTQSMKLSGKVDGPPPVVVYMPNNGRENTSPPSGTPGTISQ